MLTHNIFPCYNYSIMSTKTLFEIWRASLKEVFRKGL